jgi:hypothetical protein
VTKGIREENKNFPESNENETMTYLNLWNITKDMLRERLYLEISMLKKQN